MKPVWLASALACAFLPHRASAELTTHINCSGTEATLTSECERAGQLRCTHQSLTLDEKPTMLVGHPTTLHGAVSGHGLDYYVQDWACATVDSRPYLVLASRCAAGFRGCRDDDNREDKDITQFLPLDGHPPDGLRDPRSPGYATTFHRLRLDRAFASGLAMTHVRLLPSDQH